MSDKVIMAGKYDIPVELPQVALKILQLAADDHLFIKYHRI